MMSKKKISYKEAIEEVEQILESIDNQELDVDELSDKVQRASLLLRMCSEKLHQTEQEVKKVFESEPQ